MNIQKETIVELESKEVLLSEAENISLSNQQPASLMSMISHAVANGADIDVISKLMDAQDRYDQKMAKKEFDTAMSLAMAEMPSITKSNEVDFTSRNGGGRTSYKYEDLNSIAEVVKPVLKKYGLSYRFNTKQDNSFVSVTCIISHKDGYSESNTLTAPNDQSGNKNSIQAIGSTLTYLQRYTLKSALGLAATDDDDAQSASNIAQLNDKQRDELLKLVDETGSDAQKLSEVYGANSIAEIPTSMFNAVKQILLARKAKYLAEAQNVNHA